MVSLIPFDFFYKLTVQESIDNTREGSLLDRPGTYN